MVRGWILIVLAVGPNPGCVRAFGGQPASPEGGPADEAGLLSDGPTTEAAPLPDVPGTNDGGGGPGLWVNVASATPFTMGSPSGETCREPDEAPHQVTLTRSFRIAAREVTQAEFQAAMGYNPALNKACATCPVERVSWSEAAAYCNALSVQAQATPCYACTGSGKTVACSEAASYSGAKIYDCPGYRLPTEAEWELAARGGTTTSFYGGDITKCMTADPLVGQHAWYKSNANDVTHPVGSKLAGPLGLYDTAGNVYEWTHDFYANYPADPATDPVGPSTGTHRVVRGGSFWDEPTYLRLGARGVVLATTRNESIGLRWVRSVVP